MKCLLLYGFRDSPEGKKQNCKNVQNVVFWYEKLLSHERYLGPHRPLESLRAMFFLGILRNFIGSVTVAFIVLSVFLLERRMDHLKNTIIKRDGFAKGDLFKFQIFGFNIKNNAHPSNLEPGEEPWSTRKEGVVSAIKNRTSVYPTLVGLEEVVDGQLDDILDGLGPDWDHYGVLRGGDTSDNERNPVLFNTSEFLLDHNQTYWLSTSPDTPSKSWNSDYNRIVTTTRFKHLALGKDVNFLVTQLSANSSEARVQSAHEILNITGPLGGSGPVFLTGDFNSHQNEEPYRIISSRFSDAANGTSKREFGISYEPRLDFVLYQLDSATLKEFKVMNGTYDGYYVSDHAPLYAVFDI